MEPIESSATAAEGRTQLPSQHRVVQPSVETRESEGDAAARGEHGKRPDHDGCTSMLVDLERRGHEESLLARHPTLSRTADDLPKHEPSSARFSEFSEAIAAVADSATKMLENFPGERSRLLSALSREFGWRTWRNDDEDWTRKAA